MKYVKAFAGLVLFYVLPLAGNTDALMDPRVWIAAAAAVVLLISQPDMKKSEAAANVRTDRNSIYLILCAAMISLVAPLIDWAYLRFNSLSEANVPALAISFSLIIGGLGLRIYAIRYLGRFFTATVRVMKGQHIVTDGPYALVRHPSYLGAYAAIIGSAILFESLFGMLVSTVSMLLAYTIRIRCEEVLLTRTFGSRYSDYQQSTKQLIPYVW